MKLSEVAVLLLTAAAVFGLVVMVVHPDAEARPEEVPQPVRQEVAESTFGRECMEVGYGAGQPPRIDSLSGDTIVMRIDLDTTRFTQPQANLRITRLLRRYDYDHRLTRRREDGGLSFLALRPDGYPLRIELKIPAR
jgi:hypothetical protein